MTTTSAVQLDLFGEVEAAARAAEADAAHAAARDAAFDELVATATVTADAAEAMDIYNVATAITVLICPACGAWEPNEMLLSNNHGIRRQFLVQLDSGEWANSGMYLGRNWCMALDLTANHATYGDGALHPRQHKMLARLRPDVRARYDAEVAARPHRGPDVGDAS